MILRTDLLVFLNKMMIIFCTTYTNALYQPQFITTSKASDCYNKPIHFT